MAAHNNLFAIQTSEARSAIADLADEYPKEMAIEQIKKLLAAKENAVKEARKWVKAMWTYSHRKYVDLYQAKRLIHLASGQRFDINIIAEAFSSEINCAYFTRIHAKDGRGRVRAVRNVRLLAPKKIGKFLMGQVSPYSKYYAKIRYLQICDWKKFPAVEKKVWERVSLTDASLYDVSARLGLTVARVRQIISKHKGHAGLVRKGLVE